MRNFAPSWQRWKGVEEMGRYSRWASAWSLTIPSGDSLQLPHSLNENANLLPWPSSMLLQGLRHGWQQLSKGHNYFQCSPLLSLRETVHHWGDCKPKHIFLMGIWAWFTEKVFPPRSLPVTFARQQHRLWLITISIPLSVGFFRVTWVVGISRICRFSIHGTKGLAFTRREGRRSRYSEDEEGCLKGSP